MLVLELELELELEVISKLSQLCITAANDTAAAIAIAIDS